MQTTIVYDTHITYGRDMSDSNYGAQPAVTISGGGTSYIDHGMYYWNIPMDNLIELKLQIQIKEIDGSTLFNGLNAKFDLYALASPFNENTVTWNNAPKGELIKKDFLSIVVHKGVEGTTRVLDLSPYADKIKNGIMLKLNNSIFVEANNNTISLTVKFHSSESPNPPILIYNYGSKPLAPKITSPEWGSIINKKNTSTIRFEWDSIGQTNYIFEYSQDNITWTKLEGATTKFVNLAISGLNNGGLYVKVKIKSNNMWSDYSQTWFLQIGEKPNSPIVSLIGITTSTPIISWNTNPLQKMYQVQVLQDGSIIIDSGEIQGTLNQYILKSRLEDNKPYTFKVRIADEHNIWSDWSTKVATVNFIKPPIPTFSLYLNPSRGSAFIKIQNPTPGTGEELTVFNEIFRKEGSGEWLRIATNVIGEFNDFTIKPNVELYYKVRAIGQNGYVDSIMKATEFNMRHSDLSIVGEWEKHVKLKYNEKKQQNTGYSGSLLVFSGRNKSVIEFDDNRSNDIAIEFEGINKDDLEILQGIIDSRRTLLFRDSRGRKIYGSVASKLNIEDAKFKYYKVSFTFTETDFNEVV